MVCLQVHLQREAERPFLVRLATERGPAPDRAFKNTVHLPCSQHFTLNSYHRATRCKVEKKGERTSE